MEFDAMSVTPRVNGNLLGSYVNQTVRLVGRVTNMQHQTVTLEASDSVPVAVHRTPDTAQVYSVHPFVEVLGTVQPDLSIQEIAVTSFGQQFDLQNYDQLVKFIHVSPVNQLFGISL